MPQLKPLIDAYIDANIILFVAFLFWCLVRAVLDRTSLRQDYNLQLRLSEGFMLAAVLSPLIAHGFSAMIEALRPGQTLNASDIVLAQFLNGRLSMDAAQFESLLNMRQNLVLQIAYFEGPLAQSLVIGLAGFTTWFAFNALKDAVTLRRIIKSSYLWRRSGSVDLHLSDTVRIPFSTRGIRRRHVVIPSSLLASPSELRISLAHELQHMRRHDTEWEVILCVLRPLFVWNPAFLFWKRDIDLLRELGCDQVVLSRARVSPQAYAKCLLDMCKRTLDATSATRQLAPVVPFLALGSGLRGRRNFNALRQRVLAISAPAPRRLGTGLHFWGPLMAVALMIGLIASSIQRPGDWSQDRLMLSTIVNLERLETLNAVTLRSW